MSSLGPKLAGKIHIYVGEAENYFSERCRLLDGRFLKSTKIPFYGGEVDYDRAPTLLEWRSHGPMRSRGCDTFNVPPKNRRANHEERAAGADLRVGATNLAAVALYDKFFSEPSLTVGLVNPASI